jgi:hypothetical protein
MQTEVLEAGRKAQNALINENISLLITLINLIADSV